MYNYKEQKKKLFTDEGQRTFLKIRDRVLSLLEESGAVTLGGATAKASGNNWLHIACIDRMVELRELREIKQAGEAMGQDRIFVKP